MSKTTRWWWVRHAPVTENNGKIYGQDDLNCDCSDAETFARLGGLMPRDAVWVTSNLKRTHQTAAAIVENINGHRVPEPLVEHDFAEQHFGEWQGMTNVELAAQKEGEWHRFWLAPATEAPPGGESFVNLFERTSRVIHRLSEEHAGRDIVAVTHGGTIRAAIALALGLEPERALSFSIDNCALTRLDHITGTAGTHAPEPDVVWRIGHINLVPKTTL